MLTKMCKENSYAKMEKLEAQILYVGVQGRALELCPGRERILIFGSLAVSMLQDGFSVGLYFFLCFSLNLESYFFFLFLHFLYSQSANTWWVFGDK